MADDATTQNPPAPDGSALDRNARTPSDGPRTALVASAVVAVLAALLVAVLATRDPSTERVTQSPLIGQLAPPIAGTTLDGRSFDLASQRGRWVVVNFFATWCTPCLQEHPELVRFDEEHRERGDASIVSVLYDDEPEQARRVFEERGGEWPVVTDERGSVGVAYGVARVPESFLVAPDGTVVQRLVGGVTAAQLDDLLAQYEGAGR
jgi:cytochrome c biogenesis protein CcmG/thiol:disulfide interchange protein DsbE